MVKRSVKRKSSKRRRTKKALGKGDKCAIIEYLEYIPINSEGDANNFYKKIDRIWSDGANYVELIIMDSLKIDNLDILEEVSRKSKKSCKRTNGNCEDTSKYIMDELRQYNKKGGKYIVEYHRAEYYESIDSDYDEETNTYIESQTPEFIQNHAYIVVYEDKYKSWFRYTSKI